MSLPGNCSIVAQNPGSISESDYKTIRDVCLSEIGIYAVMMLAVIHNSYFYIFKQKRFRIFTLTSFYICATLLISFRVT